MRHAIGFFLFALVCSGTTKPAMALQGDVVHSILVTLYGGDLHRVNETLLELGMRYENFLQDLLNDPACQEPTKYDRCLQFVNGERKNIASGQWSVGYFLSDASFVNPSAVYNFMRPIDELPQTHCHVQLQLVAAVPERRLVNDEYTASCMP